MMYNYDDIKIRHGYQKPWVWNMRKIIINYQHKGEANDLYLVHMNNKCRIDRLGGISKIWSYRL